MYIVEICLCCIHKSMTQISKPFDWNQARAFLATAEEGSLSAAARLLGQRQPTLSRQVANLESDLGVMLFERIGRRLILTRPGLELLEHFKAMGAQQILYHWPRQVSLRPSKARFPLQPQMQWRPITCLRFCGGYER